MEFLSYMVYQKYLRRYFFKVYRQLLIQSEFWIELKKGKRVHVEIIGLGQIASYFGTINLESTFFFRVCGLIPGMASSFCRVLM